MEKSSTSVTKEDIMSWLVDTVPVPESKGKRWSPEEVNQLLIELSDPANRSITAIASTHGRTCGAIESRTREIAVDMIEKGDDIVEVGTRTRLSTEQINEAVEKRAAHVVAQQRKKEEKMREKAQKEAEARAAERSAMKTESLSIEQQCALQQFEDDDNLFITGEGGTGRHYSYVIWFILPSVMEKRFKYVLLLAALRSY